jgi:uncharacterized protein YbjT (DUF2867 family)
MPTDMICCTDILARLAAQFRCLGRSNVVPRAARLPLTIIRSTQFLEFLGAAAASSTEGNMVRISPGLFQLIAAEDVAAIVADVALAGAAKRYSRDRRP